MDTAAFPILRPDWLYCIAVVVAVLVMAEHIDCIMTMPCTHSCMYVKRQWQHSRLVSAGNSSSLLDTRVAHLYFSYTCYSGLAVRRQRASGQPKSRVTIFLLTNPIKTTPDHQMLRIYTSRAPAHMAQMLPGFSAGLNTLFCMTMPIVVVVVCCHHHHRLQLHPWHPNMLLWTSTDVVVVLYMCVN